MNNSGDYRKSIRDSLKRITKLNYYKVDDSEIRMCTVVAVYDDDSELDTFGTIDVIDDADGLEYFGVPVNAHINDDETIGVSGSYTFPKVNSAVILKEFGLKGAEQHIPIMYSHVEKILNICDTEHTTKIIEVETNDLLDPYSTSPTGKEVSNSLTADQTEELITDGSTISTVTKTPTVLKVETDGGDGVELGDYGSKEPATLGDKLKTELLSFIDELGKITVQTPAGTSSPLNTSPAWAVMKTKFQSDFDNFQSDNVSLN